MIWLISHVRNFAYPHYECADCIGMKDHGCQCMAYGAVAPGVPADRIRLLARRLLKALSK